MANFKNIIVIIIHHHSSSSLHHTSDLNFLTLVHYQIFYITLHYIIAYLTKV